MKPLIWLLLAIIQRDYRIFYVIEKKNKRRIKVKLVGSPPQSEKSEGKGQTIAAYGCMLQIAKTKQKFIEDEL